MKSALLFLLCAAATNSYSLSLSCREAKIIESKITTEVVTWNYSIGDVYVIEDGMIIDAVIKPSIAGNKFHGIAINVIERDSVKYSFNPATGISKESVVVSLAGQKKLISNYQFIITYADQEYCPSVIYRYTGFVPAKK